MTKATVMLAGVVAALEVCTVSQLPPVAVATFAVNAAGVALTTERA